MGFLADVFGFAGTFLEKILDPAWDFIKDWISPDAPDRQGLKIQRQGSDFKIPVVYGTREVGGIVADKNVTDADGGAENEFLHVLVVFCHGQVDGIEEVFFNGISWNDERWKKKNSTEKWFTYEQRLGGTDNNTAVDAETKLNRFSETSSKYEGLCFMFFTFQQAEKESIWRGEPKITARIRGKRCLDFRTGVTDYTENPAVHLYDYMTNSVYGKSLTNSDIDLATLEDVANIADIGQGGNTRTEKLCYYNKQTLAYECINPVVTNPTFARYSHNNIIDTSRTHFDNIKEIANAFRGYFPESDGKLSFGTEIEGSSVFSFDADNMLSSITSTQPNRNNRYNRCVVRFPNVDNRYKEDEAHWPESDNPLYQQFLDEDNGVPLEKSISVEGTVYLAEVLQLAELVVKASRNGDQVQFTGAPEAAILDVGDIVDITDENRGWINKEFRIVNISYRSDYNVDITAIQHENAIYPWTGIDYDAIIGGTFLGDPTSLLAPTNLTLTVDPDLVNTGTLTWDSENNSFITNYFVVITKTEDENGTPLATPIEVIATEVTSRSYIVPLLDVGGYSATVQSQSSVGALSPVALITFTLATPVAPTSLVTIPKDWQIEVRPQLAGIGLGTSFEFDLVLGDGTGHTPTPDGLRATTRTFTGLLPDTLYTVYARTVNAFGFSAWTSAQATTTNTGEQIAGPIGDITDELANIDLILDDLDTSIKILDFSKYDVNDYLEEISQDITEAFERREDVNNESLQRIQQYDELSVSIDGVATAVNTRIDEVEVDVEGNATAISGLQLSVTNVESGLTAVNSRVDSVEITADGNATAVSALQLSVSDLDTELSAQIVRVDAVELTADGNATAISTLQGQVNDPVNNTSALYSFVQTAQTTADGNASSITVLQNNVTNLNSDLTAAVGRIDAVEITADNNASAISAVQGQIDDPVNNTSALYQFVQAAQTTADGNASSITSIFSGVTGEAGEAAALAKLSAYATDGGLGARAFFGTDVNDRVTGIIIDDSGTDQRIEFVADSVAFVDGAGTLKVYYDLVDDKYIFDGEIRASSGFFAGELQAANGSFAGTLAAVDGTFTGTLSAADGTFTGDLTAAGGTFAGDLSAAGGTFNGAVSIVRNTNRLRLDPGSDLVFWYGPDSITVANQTKQNGVFWIADDGTFSSTTYRESTRGTFSTNSTYNVDHKTVKGFCDLDLYLGTFTGTVSNVTAINGSSGTLTVRLKDGANILFSDTVEIFISGSPPGIIDIYTDRQVVFQTETDNTSLDYYTSKTYTVEFIINVPFTYSTPTTPVMQAPNCMIRTLEVRDLGF